ncbi:MAG: hypothetical protein ACR2RL_10905 [Gammaproteobacteria bacterium]
MPDRLTTETFDLSKTSAAFVSQFSKELFVAHNRIFAGLDEETFVRYVFRSGATATKIRIYRNEAHAIVGYAAVHRYRKRIWGKSVTVFRAEAGLLPEYRGHGTTFYFYTLELAKYFLLHPAKPIFYLGVLVHPSSYLVFARYFQVVYPKRDCETPEKMYRVMQEMVDSFGIPAVDPSDPLIRRVGWTTRQAKQFWVQTQDPDVVFFRKRNPGYCRGHGLVIIVPITIKNLLGSFAVYAYEHLKRRLAAHVRGGGERRLP